MNKPYPHLVGKLPAPNEILSNNKVIIFEWWRTQSQSNRSQHPNSLLTGKNTGKFIRIRLMQHGSLLESADISATFEEIPCRSEQGNFGGERGKYFSEQGNLLLIPAMLKQMPAFVVVLSV